MLSPRPGLSRLSNLELLSRLRSLSWLSPQQLKRLSDAMTVTEVRRHGVIFREQAHRSGVTYILLIGTVQLSYLGGGSARAVAILSPGLIFRPPPMPVEAIYNFECTGLTNCRVAKIPQEKFIAITLGVSPDHFVRVSDFGDGRLGGILARYPGFHRYNLVQRVTVALIELVRDFGVRDARGLLLRVSPTHHQLADLVGASRSKVTEALSDLERRSVIMRQRRQLILDPAKAQALMRSAG
jgi:CRP-like cAMP-binding protein